MKSSGTLFAVPGLELIECALAWRRPAPPRNRPRPRRHRHRPPQFRRRRSWTPCRPSSPAAIFAILPPRAGLGPASVSLVITNPPLGMRVPVADLRGLIKDLFDAAATVLRPGGRLVFANPLPASYPHPSLQLQFPAGG